MCLSSWMCIVLRHVGLLFQVDLCRVCVVFGFCAVFQRARELRRGRRATSRGGFYFFITSRLATFINLSFDKPEPI